MRINPSPAGKKFEQYLWFLDEISQGHKSIIWGPKYVVMSTEHYNELQAKLNPTKIYFDEYHDDATPTE